MHPRLFRSTGRPQNWGFTIVLSLFFVIISATSAQTSTLETLQTISTATSPIDAVAFSPDGTRIATGGRDNIIRVWDIATGTELMSTEGHAEWVTSLIFSPTGRQLISGSRDNTVRSFDADTGALITVFGSHDDDVSTVAITPDGHVVASGGRDDQIKLWDPATGDLLQTLDHFGQPIWDLAFDPSGSYLASASEDGTIWLWGLWGDTGGWLKRLDGHTAPATTIGFSQDGNWLVSGSIDGTVRVWKIDDLSADVFSPDLTLSGHVAPIMGVGFGAEGTVVISSSLDGSVRLWDVAGTLEYGSEIETLSDSKTPLTNLAVDARQQTAATISTSGTLDIWDLSPRAVLTLIESRSGEVAIAQAPNTPMPVAPFAPTPLSAPLIVPTRNQPTAPETVPQAVPTTAPASPQVIQSSVPPPANNRLLSVPTADIQIGVTTFPIGQGTWEIDPWEPIVGHFQGTSWLNQTGNVVLGGHSEMPDGSAGIFRNLYNVGIGDEIFVQDQGITRRYVVVNIRSVDYRDVSVVYPTPFNRLTLITCDIPSYVAEQNLYYERLVVIADEVPL